MTIEYGVHVNKDKYPTIAAAIQAKCSDDMKTAQIFVMGPLNSKINITPDQYPALRELSARIKIFVHSAYVIHLWSAEAKVRASSLILIKNELHVADEIGAAGLIIHINENASQEDILEQLRRLDLASHRTRIYIENVWGKHYVDSYANIARLIPLFHALNTGLAPARVHYCLDTSHLWAQGFDVSKPDNLREYLAAIKPLHPLIHLNDNKYVLAALRDEHDPIGKGKIWTDSKSYIEVFKAGYPMIFERSKTDGESDLAIIREYSKGAN
jgi:deoxyribonuclease-4